MLFRPISESRRNRWGFVCRLLLVLLVTASFAVLQAESVVDLHAHHHGGPNDHCCPGCHSGHYPILQTSGSIEFAALGFSEWHSLPNSVATTCCFDRTLNSSRAPPA